MKICILTFSVDRLNTQKVHTEEFSSLVESLAHVRSVIHLSLKKQRENFSQNDSDISKNKWSKNIFFAYVKNTLADFSWERLAVLILGWQCTHCWLKEMIFVSGMCLCCWWKSNSVKPDCCGFGEKESEACKSFIGILFYKE